MNSAAVPSGLTSGQALWSPKWLDLQISPIIRQRGEGWSAVSFRDVTLAQCFSS